MGATQASTDSDRISKMWSTRGMECHSALNREEILKCATTCMNLEDTTLN